MTLFRLARTALLATGVASASVAAQPAAPSAPKRFELLGAGEFRPEVVLPSPPARGSEQEKQELAALRGLIAGASPARLARARVDDANETPSIFDAAVGTKLETLPATWALLRSVQHDADLAAEVAKVRFERTRPWGIDPTLPNCDAGKGKQPVRSYPSGHATLGYSVGLMLATLLPAKAAAIEAKAADYAISREICGVHFPSDVEASHVVAVIVTTRILLDPAAAPRIAIARRELAKLP